MTFKDYFQKELKVERSIGVLVRFNIKRTECPNGLYVFVEGPSDKKFYSSTCVSKLRTDLYFFGLKDDYANDEKEILGKKAVLTCYSSLKHRKDIGSSFKRCIFIIDRDYDPEIECSDIEILQEDKERLSMTCGHSFENYFLEQENLRKLFAYYSLSELDFKEYQNHFCAFSERAGKFFAALATISFYYGDSRRKYIQGYKVDTIFNNDILIDEGIDMELYRYEYNQMMEYIQQDNKYLDFYKRTKKTIMEAPGLYIRGHNCYYHLEQYLAKRHHVYLAADYRRIAKIFTITFHGYDLQIQ